MSMKKYKISALIGIIVMGIGSFLSCLSPINALIQTGNIMLVFSIAILIYAFSKWQP